MKSTFKTEKIMTFQKFIRSELYQKMRAQKLKSLNCEQQKIKNDPS